MITLNSFLKIRNDHRTSFQIIGWWELRRILYNFVVLIFGILSINIMSRFIIVKPGADTIDPLLIVFFAFWCNVAYTLGWIIEILIPKSNKFAPGAFRSYLYFTLFWVFLPTFYDIIKWIIGGIAG